MAVSASILSLRDVLDCTGLKVFSLTPLKPKRGGPRRVSGVTETDHQLVPTTGTFLSLWGNGFANMRPGRKLLDKGVEVHLKSDFRQGWRDNTAGKRHLPVTWPTWFSSRHHI